MRSTTLFLFLVLMCKQPALAQTDMTTAAGDVPSSALWHLMRYSSVLDPGSGPVTPGVAGMTFSLYDQPSGGAPLWMETQNVPVDSQGHYTALLGAVSADGIPREVFSSGGARWLGIQVSGRSAEERVFIATVPYAAQSGDAQSLGGKSATEYVLRDQINQYIQQGVRDELQIAGFKRSASTSAGTSSDGDNPENPPVAAAGPPAEPGGNAQGVSNAQLKALLDQIVASIETNDNELTALANQIMAKLNAPPTIDDVLQFEFCTEPAFNLEGESQSWVRIEGTGQGRVGADVYGNGAVFSLEAKPGKQWEWSKKVGWDVAKLGACVDLNKLRQWATTNPATVSSTASFDSRANLTTTGLLDSVQNIDKAALVNKMLSVANTLQMDPAKIQNAMDIAANIQESGGLFEAIQNDSSRTAILDALPIPPNFKSFLQSPGSLITTLKQVKDNGICNMTGQVPALQPLLGEICNLARNPHFAQLLDRMDTVTTNIQSRVTSVQTAVNNVSNKVQDIIDVLPGGRDCRIFCR
jgi:hypothetical protein